MSPHKRKNTGEKEEEAYFTRLNTQGTLDIEQSGVTRDVL